MNTLAADAVDVTFSEDEISVTLADGRRVSAPLEWFPRLLKATRAQRAKWSLIGQGVGIRHPRSQSHSSVEVPAVCLNT